MILTSYVDNFLQGRGCIGESINNGIIIQRNQILAFGNDDAARAVAPPQRFREEPGRCSLPAFSRALLAVAHTRRSCERRWRGN